MKQFLFLLVLISAATTLHADVTKFNPPDSRLDKKITLDFNHVKLEDLVNGLGKYSGVTIKAGTNERDWKVREQRLTIHVKEMPVGTVLDKITSLLGFYLSREGKDKEWSYVIWQDKKSRDLEAEMLNAEKEAEAQRIAKQRQAGIDLAKEALDMSPADALAQKDKNPLLAYLGGTKAGRGCAQFLSSFDTNFPTEYDLMMRGNRAFLPLSALPSGMQQALTDATSGGLAGAFKGMAGGDMSPYQMVMTPATDILDSSAGNAVPDIMNMGMMVMTGLLPGQKPDVNGWLGGGNILTLFPLTDGDTPLGKFAGQTLLDADKGADLGALNKKMADAMSDPAQLQSMLAHDSPTEKKLPTDPDLTREVEIKDLKDAIKPGMTAEERLGIMMAEASRATGYPVLMESFKKPRPVDLFVHPGKQQVYKLLIGLEKAGYTWIKDDDKTIRVRPVDWAFRRSCEIAESYFKEFDAIMDKHGYHTMEDVAQIMAGLSEDQIRTQLSDDWFRLMSLGRLVQDAAVEREMLRTYASLSPGAKEALVTEEGLPFAQMTDDQWSHISDIVAERMSGSHITDGSVRLVPQTDKQIQAKELARTFEIRAFIGDRTEPDKLYIGIPLGSQGKQAADLANWNKAVAEALKPKPDKPAATK